MSDWSGDLLRTDGRWKYGTPPTGNANYAWIQHFLYHLAPNGQAGFVISKGALTSKSGGEGEIRKALIEDDLIDCIVNLPAKLFLNTQIPASLWFMSRKLPSSEVLPGGLSGYRNRSGEILFIDARHHGHLINRRTKVLSPEDIKTISDTYHNWKFPSVGGVSAEVGRRGKVGLDDYQDIPGFCASVPLERAAELDYVLTPGRYVGLPEEEDDFDFVERGRWHQSQSRKIWRYLCPSGLSL